MAPDRPACTARLSAARCRSRTRLPARRRAFPRDGLLRSARQRRRARGSRCPAPRARASNAPASAALKDQPHVREVAGARLRLAHEKVDRAAVAPHDAGGIVRVDLQEQSPRGRAFFQRWNARILRIPVVAAEDAVAGELAFYFHGIALNRGGQPAELMTRLLAELFG